MSGMFRRRAVRVRLVLASVVLPRTWQISHRDVEVAERLQEEDAGNNDKKATQVANDIVGWEATPFAKQHGWSKDHTPGEHNIQQRSYDGRVEYIQRSVQVDHLHIDTQ